MLTSVSGRLPEVNIMFPEVLLVETRLGGKETAAR
jgi:hypothetical protein